MRKLIIFLCLFLSVMALHARAIQEDYRNAEEKARVSYAFGMIIGSNLSTAPIEFDYNAFTDGLRAILDNTVEAQFSEYEAMEIVETALFIAMEIAAEENRIIEETFMITNSMQPGIQVTQSGLQYEIIRDAEGEKPLPNSVVKVNYVGTFLDGSPFDSSYDEGGIYVPLDMVIHGWSEGLQMMSVGSIYRLFIPSSLAYGKDGFQGIIPPYSTLLFTVELLEIVNDDYDIWEF